MIKKTILKNKQFSLLVLTILCVIFTSFFIIYAKASEKKVFWPTKEWKTSTPESEGVDSEGLANMVDQLKGKKLHSLLIERDGNIIAEGYNFDHNEDTKQDMLSVTKSITSALIGIAINDKKIGSVKDSIDNYLNLATLENGPQKKQIRIDHLLTMTSGLQWNNNNETSTIGMINSPNWIQYILNLNLAAESGTQYVYSNGGAHLLSAIIQKATGQTESDYAKKVMFDPIGIQNYTWASDPQGITIGAYGLLMTTRDIAKFGYLYLNDGMWDGKRIVPENWVQQSTKKWLEIDNKSQPFEKGYGYLWWLASDNEGKNEFYSANGSGGQSVVIIPKENMLAVFTADNNDAFFADPIIYRTLLPAIKDRKPLPPDPKGDEDLQTKLNEFKKEKDIG